MPLDNTSDPELELKTLAVDLKKATDEVRQFAERANTEIKNLGKVTEETKQAADKAITGMNEISARLTDVEQKMARRPGGTEPQNLRTLGEHVINNDQVKALLERKNGQARVTVELKDMYSGTGLWGTGTSVTTSLTIPDRQPIVQPPLRPLVVRDLLTPGTTTSNAIEYPVETDVPMTGGLNATQAAVVSEGAKKAQSQVSFDLKSTPVRTIAHFMKASRQIMDDAPQLQSYIDGRLRYGLQFAEEIELLTGDGTGQHLLGIIPQASSYSAAFTPESATQIDAIRLAILQATLAYYPTTGIILHPTDWAKIEVTKDTLGRYIVGDPQGQVAKRLWTLPVVDTQAMSATHFLVGAFRLGAQIFDRQSIEVLISTENEDDFVKNMITIRGEERLALAVYRPGAFIYGTLPAGQISG